MGKEILEDVEKNTLDIQSNIKNEETVDDLKTEKNTTEESTNNKINEETQLIVINAEKKKNKKNKKNITKIIVIFIFTLLFISIKWLNENTGTLSIEQIVFHMTVPLKGTNNGIILDYIKGTIPVTILGTLAIGMLLYIISKIMHKKEKAKKYIIKAVILIYIAIILTYIFCKLDIFGYLKNQFNPSKFIEENYVDAKNVSIEFPEQKRNIIYIYLESMESTFSSFENGGMYEGNYIEELQKLADSNIHFSNTEKLGGAYPVSGTGWTVAAIVSQTSGMPLKVSIDGNTYGNYKEFLPGVTSFGEILEENGYKNYFIMGSESEFGGRKEYLEQHGNYTIFDVNTAIEEGKMTSKDKVWWGYKDSDLIKYSKEKLLEISKNDEPFNFSMLTVDTHFTDGYKCDSCGTKFSNQYANVMACSSKQISEFVKWIQQQDFYENTTIVISGDHLTMQATIEEDKKQYDKNYRRTVYNTIINSKVENVTDEITKNREFSTLDMLPTTLAAMGVTVENNRIGLGTNLFSGEQTLIEKFGYDYFNKELEKKSNFYKNKIILNKK